MPQLVDQYGCAALGQEEKREAGRDRPVLLDHRTLPEAGKLVLLVDQFLGSQAVPVMLAEEPKTAQSPGAFETVQVVELPLLAVTVILPDLEVIGQPVDTALEADADASFAAIVDHRSIQKFLSLEAFQTGDDEAGNSRAGHARRRGRGVGSVGPASITLLATLPVGSRQCPDLRLDGHADFAGRAAVLEGHTVNSSCHRAESAWSWNKTRNRATEWGLPA